MRTAPTPDGLIQQFAWKDNALALFYSTVLSGDEEWQSEHERSRKQRPRGSILARCGQRRSLCRCLVTSTTTSKVVLIGGTKCAPIIHSHIEFEGVDTGRYLQGFYSMWPFVMPTRLLATALPRAALVAQIYHTWRLENRDLYPSA